VSYRRHRHHHSSGNIISTCAYDSGSDNGIDGDADARSN
jgi:hypothetical protein